MVSIDKKLAAIFFETTSGNKPVREWLKDLPAENKKIIGTLKYKLILLLKLSLRV